ncbi:MAG: GNAT family N-acetyltransferase [Rhizobiaceae bacterium]|nr:GNAT family N-acetyltransferase [Rhizobiaceae bacterium]
MTELCLRSKAHWGYDDAFIAACRAELTIDPGDIHPEHMRVAVVDDLVAGYVELERNGRDLFLDKLYIEPTFLGQGVGRALMEWATAQAASWDHDSMIIEADPSAVGFYRRMGARDAGTAPSGSIPGRWLPRLVLELPD